MARVGGERVELVLDQNFPLPILACLEKYLVDIRLVPLRHIDPRLSELSDRQLLIALHQLGWAGLVTNDYHMLRNPADLAALLRTSLSVFAIEGLGHAHIAQLATLRDQQTLFGAVASAPTAWRVLDRVSEEHLCLLSGGRGAARAAAWAAGAAPDPPASCTWTSTLGAHSEKEEARPPGSTPSGSTHSCARQSP